MPSSTLRRTNASKDATNKIEARERDQELAEQFESIRETTNGSPGLWRNLECDGLDYEHPIEYFEKHHNDLVRSFEEG